MAFTIPSPGSISTDTTGLPAWMSTLNTLINAALSPVTPIPSGPRIIDVTVTAAQLGFARFNKVGIALAESRLLNEYRAAGWTVNVWDSFPKARDLQSGQGPTSLTYRFERWD